MKKVYKAPQTETVKISFRSMLANSYGVNDQTATGTNSAGFLSREQKTTGSGNGGGLWSDMK